MWFAALPDCRFQSFACTKVRLSMHKLSLHSFALSVVIPAEVFVFVGPLRDITWIENVGHATPSSCRRGRVLEERAFSLSAGCRVP